MSAKRNEEFDWIFDYVLQFLESDKFDAAVMDFVDENCYVFDSDDENKFIYSDIHAEFHDHIEALISSNLGELGITTEMFYDSCEKGRKGRDVNQAVFEKMLAMDDFLTFKKIMVKRNMELQLESFKAFSMGAQFDDDEDDGYLNSSGMIDGKFYNEDDDDDDMLNIGDEEILKEVFILI
jgi:ethanolamine ammonia-lyase large subunit